MKEFLDDRSMQLKSLPKGSTQVRSSKAQLRNLSRDSMKLRTSTRFDAIEEIPNASTTTDEPPKRLAEAESFNKFDLMTSK